MLATTATESYTPVDLFTGDQDIITVPVTVVSGQNLAALTVVGKNSTTGKIAVCNLGANDGTQTPYGILINAIDASGGDKAGQVYTGGCFNPDALTWHASFDSALKKAVAFDGATSNITLRAPGNSL